MTDAVNTGEPPMNKRPTPLARECIRIEEEEGRKKRRNDSYPTRLSRNLFHDCTKKNVGLMILCRRVIVEKYRSNNGYDFSLLRDNNFKVLKSVKKGLLLVYELYMYTNICL